MARPMKMTGKMTLQTDDDQKAKIVRAAKRAKLGLTEWAVPILVDAAKREGGK
jgi:predicted HicB family RNase H-like nuclease